MIDQRGRRWLMLGLRRTSYAICLILAHFGTSGCSRDAGGVDEAVIDKPPIVELDPQADRPVTYFPRDTRTRDTEVDRFIDHVLTICEKGDYDGFRQAFGTAYQAPSPEEFARVWHGVEEIRVEVIYEEPADPPRYFVYGHVRFREEDRRGRVDRPFVIMLFREVDRWRLAPAPSEIVARIMAQATQPAGAGRPGPS